MTTKVCNTCLVEKPLSAYGTSGQWPRNRCKVCETARKAKWNAANKELKQEQQRRYRQFIAARGKSPLSVVFRKGKRCWCCRRQTDGPAAMLCGKCMGRR